MSLKMGVIAIRGKARAASDAMLQALFGEGQALSTVPDADEMFRLDIDTAMVIVHADWTVVLNSLLASNIVDRDPKEGQIRQEEWIAQQSSGGEALVAYTHGSTATCGHRVYVDGRCLARYYVGADNTFHSQEPVPLPAWYAECPKSFTKGYAVEFLEAFLDMSIYDALDAATDIKAYHI